MIHDLLQIRHRISINSPLMVAWLVIILSVTNAEICHANESEDEIAKVQNILEQVQKITANLHDDNMKVEFLVRIALVQAKLGDKVTAGITFNTALEIANSMTAPIGKFGALGDIAQFQKYSGDHEAVQRTLEQENRLLEAASVPGNKNPHTVIKSMIESGDIKGALNYAAAMKPMSDRSIALHHITAAQAEAGDIKGALQTANMMTKDFGYRARAMIAIAFYQANAGDDVGAFATVDAIQEVDEVSFKATALWGIAVIQNEKGNTAAAVTTMQKAIKANVPRLYLPPFSYSKVRSLLDEAETEAQLGDRQAALNTIKQAITEANTIRDESGKAWALTEIIIAQTKSGDLAGALNLQKSINQENPFTDLFLPYIAKAQIDAGNVAGAIQIAKMLGSPAVFDIHDPYTAKSAILLEVSVAQAKAGNVEGALQSLDDIKSGFFLSARDEALSTILSVQGESGTNKVIEWATRRPVPYERALALLAVAEAIIKQRPKTEMETTTSP